MALARLVIDGYGQLELNNAAFRRDGRIEAQCALDSTDFATAPCENGMLLAVDKANKVIKFATDASLPIAINYSAEHMYDERANGLKDFKINYREDGEYFYPESRMTDKYTVKLKPATGQGERNDYTPGSW